MTKTTTTSKAFAWQKVIETIATREKGGATISKKLVISTGLTEEDYVGLFGSRKVGEVNVGLMDKLYFRTCEYVDAMRSNADVATAKSAVFEAWKSVLSAISTEQKCLNAKSEDAVILAGFLNTFVTISGDNCKWAESVEVRNRFIASTVKLLSVRLTNATAYNGLESANLKTERKFAKKQTSLKNALETLNATLKNTTDKDEKQAIKEQIANIKNAIAELPAKLEAEMQANKDFFGANTNK